MKNSPGSGKSYYLENYNDIPLTLIMYKWRKNYTATSSKFANEQNNARVEKKNKFRESKK